VKNDRQQYRLPREPRKPDLQRDDCIRVIGYGDPDQQGKGDNPFIPAELRIEDRFVQTQVPRSISSTGFLESVVGSFTKVECSINMDSKLVAEVETAQLTTNRIQNDSSLAMVQRGSQLWWN
jgi:hypothetical protein